MRAQVIKLTTKFYDALHIARNSRFNQKEAVSLFKRVLASCETSTHINGAGRLGEIIINLTSQMGGYYTPEQLCVMFANCIEQHLAELAYKRQKQA